ncbi:MAG TPA: hypothetical protein VG675_01925 [Bryobacteraceae bacterium]|nr:hypothetical protein [Bryobacteraceae bacterium]
MFVVGKWASLLFVAVGSVLYAMGAAGPHQEFHHTYSLAAGGRVAIDNLYGDVQITGWDRDEVRVEATKTAPDAKRLDDARIVVDSTCDSLSIRTQYSAADPEQPASVEYHITVPRTAKLEGVRLVNGGLSLKDLTGPVKATAINGSIKAERLEGQAELSTINGQLEADFHRVSPSKPISLSSVNGPIVLSIPRDAGASLIAQNLSGGISSDVGEALPAGGGQRLRAVIKGGGVQIQVRNVNGGISIHSTWSRHRKPSGW